jgi:N-acetylglutamate synthase-like GNAT family acetyltransferase
MKTKFKVSTNKEYLDVSLIHSFLTTSYWAKGRTKELVQKSIDNSFCFGVYKENEEQVGFSRVITDFVTFAYISDLFILEEYRGKGLSKLLVENIMNHEKLQNIKRTMLATEDAHGLYKQYGFDALSDPSLFMEKK